MILWIFTFDWLYFMHIIWNIYRFCNKQYYWNWPIVKLKLNVFSFPSMRYLFFMVFYLHRLIDYNIKGLYWIAERHFLYTCIPLYTLYIIHKSSAGLDIIVYTSSAKVQCQLLYKLNSYRRFYYHISCPNQFIIHIRIGNVNNSTSSISISLLPFNNWTVDIIFLFNLILVEPTQDIIYRNIK